ncbi:hypothetical protein FRC12_012998, partial [Ceratobasidium sp. 428]
MARTSQLNHVLLGRCPGYKGFLPGPPRIHSPYFSNVSAKTKAELERNYRLQMMR